MSNPNPNKFITEIDPQMKKILFFITLIIVSYSGAKAQSTCATAQAFCTNSGVSFPASTGTTAPSGPNYGCLGSEPNPAWYYLQISTPGNININLSSSPPRDIDFAAWGPFATQGAMCAGTSNSPFDCSYSTATTEQVNIVGATVGQWYLVMITNFSNLPTNISANTGSGTTGATNCAILCNMTGLTANPGACNPATSTFNLTGTITTANVPTTGTLTITSSCGGSVVINPPFTSPYNYTLPGLNANGAACSVTATFSSDPTCTLTTPYTAPAPCTACVATASNTGPVCDGGDVSLSATGGGTYSWAGPGGFTSAIANPTITAATPAASGTYTVTVTNGGVNCTATTIVTVNSNPNVTPVSPVCSNAAAFNLTADIAGGTWSGAGISNASAGTFTPSSAASGVNVITYTTSSTCTDTIQITVIPSSSAAWAPPASVCVLDPAIDLSTFITGTPGGTFSGTGVTGNMFDPVGLSGNVPITYTVGSAPCIGVSTINIYVNPNVPPVITSNISAVCSNANPFNFTADIPGGTWTGSGITDGTTGMFDPSVAAATDTIIYDITGSCRGADTLFLTVNPAANAAWSTTTLCASNAPISLDSLATLGGGNSGGTWSGSGVTGNMFDPSGLSGGIAVQYIVGAICPDTVIHNITVIPNADPSWNTTSVCQVSSAINLDTTVTGTSGGTWSGTGVTGNMFNPSGLSGNIAVTYTVGTAPCQSSSTQNINVIPVSDASWTTTSLCSDASAINLDTTITGTAGGTWSGTGVTGTMFDPTGLAGPISVTYTVGPVGCQASTSHSIAVTLAGDASWTTTSMCSDAPLLNLNTLVTGTGGGTWSGTGVTGSAFNPSGLSGPISIKYVAGTAPCQDSLTQNIIVTPASTAAWTTTSMCANAAPVNLFTLLNTGSTGGGTWSGTGVTGSTFDPAGLSGTYAVKYIVGTAPCLDSLTQNITVIPNPDPTVNAVTPMCQSASSITLTAATGGGTWSGSSAVNPVTGLFNPTVAGPGTYNITYTISGACGSSSTIPVTVLADPSAAWNLPLVICQSADPLNLSTLVTGTAGGTFSGPGVNGNSFNPDTLSGPVMITYSVTQAGCSATSTDVITVDPITASFVATPTSGEAPVNVTTLNTSLNASTYAWTFGEGSGSASFEPNFTYENYGDYVITLIATNSNGCMDTAKTNVHIDQVSALIIPNVFTPNGDGLNDTFRPVIREGITEFKATVYDRWGIKLHEWTDVNQGWDGKAKSGKQSPDGTYFYIISGKGIDGKSYEYNGFVQLFNN